MNATSFPFPQNRLFDLVITVIARYTPIIANKAIEIARYITPKIVYAFLFLIGFTGGILFYLVITATKILINYFAKKSPSLPYFSPLFLSGKNTPILSGKATAIIDSNDLKPLTNEEIIALWGVKLPRNTVKRHLSAINDFLIFLDNKPLQIVTDDDVNRYQTYLQKKAIAKSTITSKIKSVRSLLNTL